MIEETGLISDRYITHAIIGEGGMGAVYRATDRLTGSLVALKQVTVDFEQARFGEWLDEQTSQALRLALAHEFQTLAALRHPHIISVLDYGFDRSRQPYFTMTYLAEAQTIVEAAQALPLIQQIKLLQQVLQALSYLHRQGILHCDLKPENVLVTDQSVRVLDFGLAAAKDQTTSSSGSWGYIAPEILEQSPPSEATDLYAVGVLTFQLLTGKLPFEPTDPDFIDRLLSERPDVTVVEHEALAGVISCLLEKKPIDRYPSAEAVITALSVAVGEPVPTESRAIRDSFLQAAQFVGRELELKQLVSALEKASTGQGSAWLIGGESGVGKSRLLAELQTQALVSGMPVLRGVGIRDGSLAFQIWREPLRRLILSSTIDDLTASVLRFLVPDIAQLLNRAITPLPELPGQAGLQRLLSTIVSLFRRQTQPMVLILEDLQWASESVTVLQQLIRIVADLPLIIIGSYRDDERPDLPTELVEMHPLKLARLTQHDMATLSTTMLGEAGQRPDVLALLQRETEGNAFFLVEVVRALAEEAGRLDQIGKTPLPEHLFPDGIRTIVQRRLAQIPADAQALLLTAAIIGRQPDLKVLQKLTPQADIEAWLTVCIQAAVLESEGDNWQFAHEKFRDGVLAQLDETDLQQGHIQVAEAIEQIYPNNDDQSVALTYHWHQAGNRIKECKYARIAGLRAIEQYANEDAIRYLSRALALTPEIELFNRYKLLHAREGIFHLLGLRDEQHQDLEMMTDLANSMLKSGCGDFRSEVALRCAKFAQAVGDFPGVISAAKEAISLANANKDANHEAAGYLALGQALSRQGKYEAALEQLEQALDQAKIARSLQVEADTLRFLAVIYTDLSRFAEAGDTCQQALQLYRQIEDRQGEGTVLNNLGNVAHALGDLVGAKTNWEKARAIYEAIGDREGTSRAFVNLGTVSMDQGNYTLAQPYYDQALQICREIGVRVGEFFALLNLGLIYRYLDQNKTSENYCRKALSVAEALGARRFEGHALMQLGHALNEQKRFEGATHAFTQATTRWRELLQDNLLAESQAALAQAALNQNKLDHAMYYVEAILAFLDKGESLDGTESPFRIYLTCFDVLSTKNDPRAQPILVDAYEQLQNRANEILDANQRQSFLENVIIHKTILEKYNQFVNTALPVK